MFLWMEGLSYGLIIWALALCAVGGLWWAWLGVRKVITYVVGR